MDSFYIFQGEGPVQGPYRESEIRSRISDGSLSAEKLQICSLNSDVWIPISDHPTLHDCQSKVVQSVDQKKEADEALRGCVGCLVVIGSILALLAILGFLGSGRTYKHKTPIDRYFENKDYYDKRY